MTKSFTGKSTRCKKFVNKNAIKHTLYPILAKKQKLARKLRNWPGKKAKLARKALRNLATLGNPTVTVTHFGIRIYRKIKHFKS